MGTIDFSNAIQPTRGRVGGTDIERARKFRNRMPPAAKRSVFIRQTILHEMRETPVNPVRDEQVDPEEATTFIKSLVRSMGADEVGIATIDPRLVFTNGDVAGHSYAVVYAMTMAYDAMAEIGPNSQDEVHRVYHALDEMGVRLAHQIGAFGYAARMQPNEGDIPLPAFGWLAGIGELGKHGSLISPKLGSSFRLGAVTTDMPLVADGPQDYGIDEVCANCNLCQRFCPGDAIKPEKKTVNGITRWYIDTPACEPYFHRLYGCKICLMVCPFNGRGDLKEQFRATAKDIRKANDAEGMLALVEGRSNISYEDFDES